MKKLIVGAFALMYAAQVLALPNPCIVKNKNYRVVKNSVFPFKVGQDKACFFAFYTKNPDPGVGIRHIGNGGDSLWYGYYKRNNPYKIYEFPKPDGLEWSLVCSIGAISFYPMHGGAKRDVTVIGTCNEYNAVNYTFPFVFVWDGSKYILDKKVNENLSGVISLTVEDVRAYISAPSTYGSFLRHRYLTADGQIARE